MGNDNIINKLCGCRENEDEDATKKDKVSNNKSTYFIFINSFQKMK